jgi:hypothetical protein
VIDLKHELWDENLLTVRGWERKHIGGTAAYLSALVEWLPRDAQRLS